MIKDILVPWVNADSERSVADAALALAAGSGAHVAVLVAVDVPAPMPSDWGAMAYDIYAKLHAEAHARANERADTLRQRFANAEVPVEVRVADAVSVFPQNTATMHARHADLTVLPADAARRCRVDAGPRPFPRRAAPLRPSGAGGARRQQGAAAAQAGGRGLETHGAGRARGRRRHALPAIGGPGGAWW